MQLATVAWPLVFAVVGALVYALTSNKMPELGRITFFVGMLWLCYSLMHAQLHL